jgi:spore coat protein U-like protein
MQVNAGTGGNDPVTPFILPPHTVSVWQVSSPAAASAELGSVGPRVAQPGLTATAAGDGFGLSAGTLLLGATAATDASATIDIKTNVQNEETAAANVTLTFGSGLPLISTRRRMTSSPASAFFMAITRTRLLLTFSSENSLPSEPGWAVVRNATSGSFKR